MSYYECWLRFPGGDYVKFPKNTSDFEGFLIATMVIDTVIKGGRDLRPGLEITVKGNLPSLHPAFTYQLRLKYTPPKPGGKYADDGGYEILPKTGMQSYRRLPWTLGSLMWSLKNEIATDIAPVRSAVTEAVSLLVPPGSESGRTITEESMRVHMIFYGPLRARSDYYRTSGMLMVRRGWPTSIAKIRKMKAAQIAGLAEHLQTSPHDLCFYGHSMHYELGEMTAGALSDVLDEARTLDPTGAKITTKPIHLAAVALYGHIKELRSRHGHTIFRTADVLRNFGYSSAQYGKMAEAALHHLVREGHMLFLDAKAECISDRTQWFATPSPVVYLQFPRDDQLKERIAGHLRRICDNFLQSGGAFTMRPADGLLPAVPGGPLNERQREAMDHILNNPITVIQGGPGSGKTFEGVDHLASIFHWTEIVTHVGRQAVALCDRLGGSTEIAATIHSSHYRMQKNPPRIAYAGKKEILIMDEVYNADDWTFEKALALAPNATRLVMVGDPDQIRPIPDEKGAGTPALDIARAFPKHVIVLNENMRQREEARAIHDVVTRVREKVPRSIKWSDDMENSPAVLLYPAEDLKEQFHRVIGRLRADTKGDEHGWQIVTFFNGSKPDTQGLGVIQINEFVEEYLDKTGFFKQRVAGKMRPRHRITNRLTMYPGMKFMITEKFIPDKAILKGKGRSAEYIAKQARRVSLGKKGGAVSIQNEPEYTETRNGQIEVVASITQPRIPGVSGEFWVVECVPKGKCVRGAKIMISRAYHVDPSKIVPAWAVTSNKSMGGECKNVAVYIPPRIDASLFDRSNLYVAVSRPINFLCVIGALSGFECLAMRDPKPIDSGLLVRLRNYEYLIQPEDGEPVRYDWGEPHDEATNGCIVPEVAEALDIYDQSKRKPSRNMVPACPVPYRTFRMGFNAATKGKDMTGFMSELRERLYGGVRDNARVFPPWKAQPDPDEDPLPEPVSPDHELSDDEEDDDGTSVGASAVEWAIGRGSGNGSGDGSGGGESASKRHRPEQPGRKVGDVGDWIESSE